MTMLRIVTTPEPDTTQRVQLDGSVYALRLVWSQRGTCWHMDIGDADGDAIITGIRMVTLMPLLYRFRYLAVPPGEFWFLDTKAEGAAPTLEQMGDRFRLYYEPITPVVVTS